MKNAILCALLLGLGSCDSGSGPAKVVPLASTYFPYQVGDTMAYHDNFGDGNTTTTDSGLRDVVRVVGMIQIGGDTYQIHQIDHDTIEIIGHGRIKPVMDSEYYFTEGSRIYWWRDETRNSMVDFAKPFVPGKTAEDYRRLEAHYVKDTTVTVPAGTFTTKIVETGEMIGMRRFYAEGVGLVLLMQDNYRRELVTAKVGGRSYP